MGHIETQDRRLGAGSRRAETRIGTFGGPTAPSSGVEVDAENLQGHMGRREWDIRGPCRAAPGREWDVFDDL
jgi:hypothetical protein